MINLLIGLYCGFLGSYAGAENTSKMWRRLGIPFILTWYLFFTTFNWLSLLLMFMIFPLSIGYGLPCEKTGDEGSSLGRFYYNFSKENWKIANVLLRVHIALLIGVSCLIIPLLKGNWSPYIWGVFIVCWVNGLFSWQNLKSIKIFGKDLLISEMVTWGIIGYYITILIGE